MEFNLLFQNLKKRMTWIVLLVAVMVIATSVVNVFLFKKEYDAVATLIIVAESRSGSDYLYSNLKAGLELKNDLDDILKSDGVMDSLKNELGKELPGILRISNEDLKDRIYFSTAPDTRVFRIAFRYSDPKFALSTVNRLTQIYKEKVADLMKIDAIAILEPAKLPLIPSTPDTTKNVLTAFIFSSFIFIVFFVMVDAAKSKFKNE